MERSRENIRNLMIAVNKIDGLYYCASRKLGIKENTLSLLYALSDGKAHTQKEICENWLIPRTTINTVVKECIDAGYVTLNPLGNKEKVVRLTEAGKKFSDTVLRDVMMAEEKAMAKTKTAFSEDFVAAFEQFAQYLQEALTAPQEERSSETHFPTNFIVKQMTETSEDIEKVRRLYQQAFPEKERKPFDALVSNRALSMEWLGFYDGEKFCGFACILDDRDISHILYLAIEHGVRNQGYGSAALAAIHARKVGQRIIVDIERENKKASNNEQRLKRKMFYLQNGYQETEIKYRWRYENYEILSYGGEVTSQEFDLFWKHIDHIKRQAK